MTVAQAADGGTIAPKRARPEDWLAGGGEMAKLIRDVDWSQTPLGPIASWPQSLRTTVSLVQASNSPISLAWSAGHVQIYNDGYWPICGAKHPTSMGQDFRECWASAFPVIGEAYASAWSGKSAYLEKMRMFLDRYGFLEETWFTFSFSPITDESGGIGGVFHPVTEMTSQMLSERRTRTLHDLASRAGRVRSSDDVFAIAAQVLAESDRDLPFVLFYLVDTDAGQARLAGLTGLGRGTPISPELIDLRAAGHSPWPIGEVARTGVPQRIDDAASRFAGMAVGPYPESPKLVFALPITQPGREKPAAVMVAGISPRLPMNEPYRSFCDFTAATVSAALANARAYEEEHQKAEALAEIDRAKTAFFSNVSHEFRTPLTLMLGPMEDALDSPGQGLCGAPLQMAHRNTLRLMKLVDSLLDFSLIESGRMHASYEPSDVAAMTTDLASAFRSAIERTGLRFEVDCASLAEPIYVDHDKWEKIVLNLLSNALKFTFEGSIGVSVRGCGDHVELEVRDTGIGIPASELPHLFERFHRIYGVNSRTHEGSGIGLALVQDLVRFHGGTVRVVSRLDQGTTFTVSIPTGFAHLPPEHVVARRSNARSASSTTHFVEEALRWSGGSTLDVRAPSAAIPASSAEQAEVRILVVDDNADLRDYIAYLLGEHYVVETAVDGLAALEAARLHKPALVLSDVMMPRLDGFGLLRALRADPALRNVPVILLSARAGEASTIAGLTAGADDYLVKPFSAQELLARVRTHVTLTHQREAFERFFTLSLDMLCIAGVDGYFKRVSPAFDALGYTSEELLSRPFLDYVHPDDTAATLLEVAKLAKNVPTIHFENRYRCKDGSYRWLSWTSAPDSSGTLYAIARDVTHVRVTQDALARAKEAAEAANRELESFSYSVAHDLRAPLRSIDGFSQILLEDYAENLDADGQKYLSFVRESAQHMARLIDDLLALSRVTRSELHREGVDMSALARAAVVRLQRSQPKRRVDVVIEAGLRDEVDPRLVTVVLDNLLGNAWKFTERRAETRIEFGATSNEHQRVYFVRDNGVGFDMAFVNKLFGVFQRLHSASEFEGTGIGLATVQRAITRHGGRVWAEGEVDRGATFFFTLCEKDATP